MSHIHTKTYTSKKTGKTKTYVYDEPPWKGSGPNLTLSLSDPTLVEDLRGLAHELGLVAHRGKQAGYGSPSQLVERIAAAARKDGPASVAKRLKSLLT